MSDPIQPKPTLHEQYVHEFRKSADLFEDALKEYQSTGMDNPTKKMEFKKVMDQALHVMSETASETCKNVRQQESEKRLEQDYQKFQKDYDAKDQHELSQDYETLLNDIRSLKETFE